MGLSGFRSLSVAGEYARTGPPSPARKVEFGVSDCLEMWRPLLPLLLLAPLFTLPSPIRSSCGRLTSPLPGPIRRGDGLSVASNPPVPSLQNLSCLISLMMDFKSDGRTRNPGELMQTPVRAHARTRGG